MNYPDINPVALNFGTIQIHWYSIMYLIGFAAAWWLGIQRAKKSDSWQQEQVGDLIFFLAFAVIIGGRLGYILFYDLANYLENPIKIFYIWQGGMSFHGGLIGVVIAIWWYGRKQNKAFFAVADFTAPLVPIGLGVGRIGNFINNELWGSTTQVAWGMIVPNGGPLPRHPSQLYEAFLEGLLLFLILWIYSRKPRPIMAVSGLFLLGYGVFRFAVEFVRVPDTQLGYLFFDWVTMGQILSLPMIILGIVLILLGYRRARLPQTER